MRNPFRHPKPPGPLPAPLTREECERIWTWERWMMGFYAFAMIAILGTVSLAGVMGHSTQGRLVVVGVLVLLALAGAFVQFREKCPRCAARLGRQSRLLLPDKCRHCGVEFPRPPRKPPGGTAR
jgi:hypothetical protein